MHTVIVIPARYASTRFPGKPLVMIKGQTLLQRVVRLCFAAANGLKNVDVIVATDDERIQAHCQKLGVHCLRTSKHLLTGTDRVAEAVKQMRTQPDFILNMQGDAPLTPPDFLRALIDAFTTAPCDVVTPVTQLSWSQLDELRNNKLSTPFSGTTAVFNQKSGHAYWFSKQIIPALRNEEELRKTQAKSPIFRHIGLYGYSLNMLERVFSLPESNLEQLEGLEQLRILEQGYAIRCVPVEYKNRANMSGVDSPKDVERAEALIAKHGELLPLPKEQG
jgi:3-deoxy-manno-octulosonate cytidylyltransferase (CMP-KDO synthetase)